MAEPGKAGLKDEGEWRAKVGVISEVSRQNGRQTSRGGRQA